MNNKFEIEYDGKNIPLLFGNWMNGELVREGFDLNNFNPKLYENPFKLAPFVIYLAACNATGNFSRDDFEEKYFLQYCEVAEKETIAKCLDIFYRSVYGDVFVDEINRISTLTPEQLEEEAKSKSVDLKKKIVKKK